MAREQLEGTSLLDGLGRWREIEGRITGIRVSDDCFSNGREKRGRLMKGKVSDEMDDCALSPVSG